MSMAIKYAMQKRARGGEVNRGAAREEEGRQSYRMAEGGEAELGAACMEHGRHSCRMCHGGAMAEGGEVHDEMEEGMHGEETNEHELDMVDRAMRKYMAEGGRVANRDEDVADFEPNEFDDMPLDDHLDSHIESDEEHGDEQEDEDRDDLLDRAMMRYRKQKNPRPA